MWSETALYVCVCALRHVVKVSESLSLIVSNVATRDTDIGVMKISMILGHSVHCPKHNQDTSLMWSLPHDMHVS